MSTSTIFSNKKTADYDKLAVTLYIVEGLFIATVNLILTVRLFSNRHLRAQKEFIVFGSCLFFDIFFGLTYFSAGVYRATLINIYDYFPLVSMWDCFLTPHNQLFILITIMAGIQLLSTAIDRFICVFFPITYIKLHSDYAYYLMFLPYFIVIPLWIPGALGAYDNKLNRTFPMNCLMNQAIREWEYVEYRTIRIICTSLCVFIYIPIFAKMCMRAQSIYNHTKIAPGSTKNGKRLLSMTKTVALITSSTICLFTVPDIITYFSPYINSNSMYLMNLNKGMLNIIIFLVTQKTLRQLMFPAKMTSASVQDELVTKKGDYFIVLMNVTVQFSDKKTADYDKVFVALYIVEGVFITIINTFWTIRLFSNRHLREQKEFIVIGSCLFFDIFFGLTYFSAGIYRAILIKTYEYFPLVSMWDCFLTPHNQLLIFVTIMAGIQLLATTLDRFICVLFPITYLKLHVDYAYYLMFLPYLIWLPVWAPGAFGAYKNRVNRMFPMYCLMNQSINEFEFVEYRVIRITCTLLCVLVYLTIFGKMYVNIINHTKILPGSSKNDKRLLRMTKTVGLITSNTICLFTVPDIITYFTPYMSSNKMYLMNLNKGMLNIVIFLVTQKPLRQLMFPAKLKTSTSSIPLPKTSRSQTPVIKISI